MRSPLRLLSPLGVLAGALLFQSCGESTPAEPAWKPLPIARLLEQPLAGTQGAPVASPLVDLLSEPEVWVTGESIPAAWWLPLPDSPGYERALLRFPGTETHYTSPIGASVSRAGWTPVQGESGLPKPGELCLQGNEVIRNTADGPGAVLTLDYPITPGPLQKMLAAPSEEVPAMAKTHTVLGRRTATAGTETPLEYDLLLEDDPNLEFGASVMPTLLKVDQDMLKWRKLGNFSVRLFATVEGEDGQVAEVWSDRIDQEGVSSFKDVSASLKPWAGQQVKLRFQTELPGPLANTDWYAIGQFGEPVLWNGGEFERPNVLVLLIDTLRADRLGSYGWERARTPRLDELASKGVRYANPMSPSSWTLPSHASIFTSTFSSQHGLWQDQRLPAELTTVGETLQSSGYRTAAFAEAGFLNARHGFDRGFEIFDSKNRDCSVTFELATDWIEARKTPYFAFVHTYQVHNPYEPPDEFREGLVRPYSGDLPKDISVRDYEWGRGGAPLTGADLDYVSDLYDAEIAYVDHQVGQFLDGLRAAGALENTLIVVTSDHGEEFFDHGNTLHGMSLYEEQLRVPLILNWPGHFEGGLVPEHPVHLVDLAPTIAAAVGVQTPLSWIGEALETTPGDTKRPLFTSMLTHWSSPARRGEQTYALREGNLKYISFPADMHKFDTSPTHALYDLDADPMELNSILDPADEEAWTKKAEDLLRAYPPIGEAEGTLSNAQLQKNLEELGYVGD